MIIGDRSRTIPEYLVRLDVRQAWKGVETGSLEILTTESGGMCGFDFKVGVRYLVFAHRRPNDGRLGASMCSLTREYNGFNDQITPFLASLAAPSPAGGRVFGSVNISERSFSPGRYATQTPVSVPVRLTGDGRTVSTTSVAGEFEFKNLKPARYELDVDVPPGYSAHGLPRAVNIPDGRACARETVSARPDARIVGRVTGPGAGSVQIEIESADGPREPSREHPVVSTRTGPDGVFQFEAIPAGRYIVGVNLKGTPTLSNRHARVTYPGPGHEPEVISVAVGQAVDLGTWPLPAPLRAVKVSGTVSWQDGSPAPNFSLFAQDVGSEGRRFAGTSTRSGPDGRFTIELLDGRTYTFTTPAFGPRDPVTLGVAPFRATDALPPLVVVIPRPPRDPRPVE